MKQVIPGERYEEHGSYNTWLYLALGLSWLASSVLRTIKDGWTPLTVLWWICAVLNLITSFLWSRRLLIADESGITFRSATKLRTLRWDEIVRIVEYQDSLRYANGLHVYAADAPDKPIFLSRDEELRAVVQRYCAIPVEKIS